MNTLPIPCSRNTHSGFYSTMGEAADAAWPLAIAAVAQATDESPLAARAFLDSRQGRHFADTVRDTLSQGSALPDAIAAATDQWMTWRIDKDVSQHEGIPIGLPYLTGFVIACEIDEILHEDQA